LNDPDLAIIPNLALSGTWNPGATEFTVILRQGVIFHDGAPFNADAVIFNWDRMAWALNTTGTNTNQITQLAELYEFPDGTPIVASITKNSDYSVTFNLAGPYIPFKALLCFSASYILSPDSTPATAYINTATGDIVGTGPFVYDEYEAGVEVNFHAFDNYWRGKANITEMRFKIITDTNARNAALLSGDIHFIEATMSTWYSTFKSSPDITFLNTSTTSNVIQYLGMNNQQINTTWREAIAYAIDYDYIVDVLREGDAVKMESPLPKGIMYANWSFDEASLDVPYARTLLQSMGFGVGLNVTVDGPDEAVWQASTFLTINYTYNIGNSFREDILVLLQDNLGKIGIVVVGAGMTWGDFIYRLVEINGRHRNMLQLYWISWSADYNDPSNFINPLFTNRSLAFNSAQYNGYTAAIEAGRDPLALNDNVQLLMEAGLSETDSVAREAIYDRIQELLIDHDRPWAWGYVSYIYHAYDNHLTGFQQNAMRKLYFYPCVWNYTVPIILPSPFTLSSDAGSPDANGDFNLNWTSSTFADNYSLFVYSSLITEINGSLTLLLDEVTGLSYDALDYSDGTYFFVVVAKNINGTTLSNNIEVIVEIEESGPVPWIPGFELWTTLFTISTVGLILLLRKKKKIS
jgi:peptide/nickel transport system substrate-binding protein